MSLNAKLSKFYSEHGRGYLPWRKTKDPYKILVSEMMLQQTQVERVVPKYHEFLRAFPTLKVLAKAPFPEVLSHWSGLGYNRRAKFLHETAKASVTEHKGTLPHSVEKLLQLPGIGPYTARAVAAFAYNQPVIFIETNIRTVYTWEYAMGKDAVHDVELLPLIEKDLKRSSLSPREFYAALMDYGSYLKRSGVRINSKSKHYTKQSPFEGSARQLRGAILRELLQEPATPLQLYQNFARANIYQSFTLNDIERELEKLQKESLVTRRGRTFTLQQ